MKIFYSFILTLLTQISFGQKESISSLFKAFEKDIEIEQTYSNGTVNWDDDTKESYYLLMQIASIDSLVKFIDNPNPAIRCIIFSGLIDKNADKTILSKIVEDYHNDTAVYQSSPTDVHITWRVNEYMRIAFNYRDSTTSKIDYSKRLTTIREYSRILLPGFRHGRIPKKALIKIDSLVFNRKDLKVLTFTAIFIRKSESEILKNESNFLSSAIKERLLKLQSGDWLIIDDIKVLVGDGTKRTVSSLNIGIE